MRIRCPSCNQSFAVPDGVDTGRGKCPHCGQRLDLSRMPRAGELQPGDTLGGCRVEGLLGRGGMAVVYKATQLSLNRTVALKVLPSDFARNLQFVERFSREASALARLSHPNIVGILDKGVEGQTYYFVMEYVEGRTLRSRLLREGKISPQETRELMQGICAALEYAHENSIVHRDLKPGNILLDANDTPKLADFGIARIVGADTTERQLTMAHMTMGSADYMAPEQREDAGKADHRADIYALGVMLYQMLTGALPVGTFKPPSRLVPGLSPSIDRVIRTALATSPGDRFDSVTRFRAALTAALSETAGRAQRRPAAARGAASRAVGIAATVGVLLALGVVAAVLLSRRGRTPPQPRDQPSTATPAVKVVAPPPRTETPAPRERPKRPEAPEEELPQVRDALAEVRAYIAAHPDDYQSQLDRLKDMVFRHSDPRIVHAIQAERDGVLRRLGQGIAESLAALKQQADAFADKRQFGAAIKAFDAFPAPLRTAEALGRLTRQAQAYEDRAKAALEEDVRRVAELLKAGKGAEAEALLRGADYALPELKKQAEAELQKIGETVAADAARLADQAKQARAQLAERVKALWAERSYPDAVPLVTEALARAPTAEARAALQPLARAAALLDGFWKAALGGARARKGRRIQIKAVAYDVVDLDGHTLVLALGGGQTRRDLKALSLDELVDLADLDEKSPDGSLTLGLLYAHDEQPDGARAKAAFERALAAGAPRPLVAALSDLGAEPEPEAEEPAQTPDGGLALDFNGASDYVELPDRKPYPFRLKAFTVEAWAWRRPAAATEQFLISKTSGWTNSASFALYVENNQWAYMTGDGITLDLRVSRAPSQPGAWTHVALVYDKLERLFFVDGKLIERTKATRAVTYDDQSLLIGTRKLEGNLASFWNGAIDEVRISIGARYQKDFTPERRLKPDHTTHLLLHFEEGKGTVPRDESRFHNVGRISGAQYVEAAKLVLPPQPAPQPQPVPPPAKP